MTLNDLLVKNGFDLGRVLVMRHRPPERELNKVLPWLAVERPEVFNAYQQTQGEKVEKALQNADFVASFIRFGPKNALFIGLFRKTGERTMTREQFWAVPAFIEMRDKFGMKGFDEDQKRDSLVWFDLEPDPIFYPQWKGKLVVEWPKPVIGWCRRADKATNLFPVHAILDESALDAGMPRWDELVLTWGQLATLPAKWLTRLGEWRGIYYINDTSDGKGYVGSAYGNENIRSRWEGTRPRVTVETSCSKGVTRKTSSSPFSNWSRRACKRPQ